MDISDFEDDNISEEEKLARVNRAMDLLNWQDCQQYNHHKKSYLEFVSSHQLELFHRLKFRRKQPISRLEAMIYAEMKEITREEAWAIADVYNCYLKCIKISDTHKVIQKLLIKVNLTSN